MTREDRFGWWAVGTGWVIAIAAVVLGLGDWLPW
jgi:hypothetical protein